MPIIRLDNLQQFAAVNVLSDPGAIGGPKVVPQCAEMTINWTLTGGKTAHNVLHCRYSGSFAGTVAQANAIWTTISQGGAITPFLALLMPPGGLAGFTIRDIGVANQPLIQATVGAAPGASTGTDLPNEAAIVVTLRTAFTGRANRGRVYLPGFASNAVAASNTIAATALTAINNWVTQNLAAGLNSNGYAWCIAQPARAAYTGSTGTFHPARPAGTVLVTSSTVRNNTWDTIRRRGLK